MHARFRIRLIWVFAGCLVLAAGCRGTSPLQRMVQVRKDPTAAVPEFDSPRQRLATVQPRVGSNVQNDAQGYQAAIGDRRGAQDENPSEPSAPSAIELTSNSQPSRSPESPQDEFRTHHPAASSDAIAGKDASPQKVVTASLADRSSIPPRTRASDRPIRSIASATSTRPPTQRHAVTESAETLSEKRTAHRSAIHLPKKATQSELLRAFRESPPEVKEQAMRQLVAALARTADATDQPGGTRSGVGQLA